VLLRQAQAPLAHHESADEEGFRYRFASGDLIPWNEIKDIYIDRGLGIKPAIKSTLNLMQ
jgi:hypothetical protein